MRDKIPMYKTVRDLIEILSKENPDAIIVLEGNKTLNNNYTLLNDGGDIAFTNYVDKFNKTGLFYADTVRDMGNGLYLDGNNNPVEETKVKNMIPICLIYYDEENQIED